jgi:AraC-like DNA-binding protein
MKGPDHALHAPAAAYAFQALGIGATLHSHGVWRPLYQRESLTTFEIEHGVEVERDRYNRACVARALAGEFVESEHFGLSDFFVPVVSGGAVRDVLAVGQFLRRKPDAASVTERWHALSGQVADLGDAEFARYLAATLDTLYVPPEKLRDLSRMVAAIAELCAGVGNARALLDEVERLRTGLAELRAVEQVWELARSMLARGSARSWSSPHRRHDLWRQGLRRPPAEVLVCMIVVDARLEPLQRFFTLREFQSAAVTLARDSEETLSGRVGEQGVSFLAAVQSSQRERRERLLDVLEKARRLARRNGLTLRSGLCVQSRAVPLSIQYEAALAAAEDALSRSQTLVEARAPEPARAQRLYALRRELAALAADRTSELAPRFERYLETTELRLGHRAESGRAAALSGLERVAEALVDSGAVDAALAASVQDGLEAEARDASSFQHFLAAVRRSFSELMAAAARPVPAQRDHAMRRALEAIHKRYHERLSLKVVARIAGYAPNHFSVLFKQRERTTFEQYLFARRLERAKQLLAGTDLSVERVAELSGFRHREYLSRVLVRALGATPLAYRKACLAGLPNAASPTFPKRPLVQRTRRGRSKVQG